MTGFTLSTRCQDITQNGAGFTQDLAWNGGCIEEIEEGFGELEGHGYHMHGSFRVDRIHHTITL